MHHSLLRNLIVTSLILFISLLFSSIDSAAQIRLAWDPNTESDLAGYGIYYGTASRTYGAPINVGNVTSYTLTGLTPGVTYYFAVTAYDTAYNESGFSNEVYGTYGTVTEKVFTPTVLSGPTGGITGTSYTYTTGGSSSNLGHSVQYQFDWKGDGTELSSWGSGTQSKTWTATGTYNVRARSRCATHPSVVSLWSGSVTVSITNTPVNNPPTVPVTLQAENFATKTTGGPTADAYCIWSNGYIEDSVNFPVSGKYSFIVTVFGSAAAGFWPKMEIRIDKSTIGSVTVNSGIWGTYVIEGNISAGIHKVAIAFTNDYYKPPEDRNLFVDSIFISSSAQLP